MKNCAIAKEKFLRISPTKIRKIADQIRNKKINEIINFNKNNNIFSKKAILNHFSQKPGQALLKAIKSATFNAINNQKMKLEKLYIHKIYINNGPILKRFCAKAKGKSAEIQKKMCHITIFLNEF